MSDKYSMEISASGGMTKSIEETPVPQKNEFFGLYSGLSKLKQRAKEYALHRGWDIPATPAATPAAVKGVWRDPPSVERLVTPSGINKFPKDQPETVTISVEQFREYNRLRRGLPVASQGGAGRREGGLGGHAKGNKLEGFWGTGAGGRGRGSQAKHGDSRGKGVGLGVRGRQGSRGGAYGRPLITKEKDRIFTDARDVINGKKRIFTAEEREQMRSLEGNCSRCRGKHGVWECPHSKEELTCSYPPCFDKRGHTIGACHDLMKRCRLEVCQDQRGHRATCHSYMPDRKPYGFGADAVEALKQIFEEHTYLLTAEEKRRVEEYEDRKKQEEKDELTPFKEYPDYNVMDEEDDDRGSEVGGGPMRRGRGPRPSPYGRTSWIYGGFNG